MGIEKAETDFWEVNTEGMYTSKCIAQNSKTETEQTQTKSLLRYKGDSQKSRKETSQNMNTNHV